MVYCTNIKGLVETVSYDEGFGNEKHKGGGLNKFIIGLVENLAESHSNLEKILNILKLNDLQYYCAFDIKFGPNVFWN